MSLFHGAILALLLMLTGQFTIPMRTGATAAHAPLNPCLISAWAMNEGSGLTLNDTSTGGTNTATINTGASVVWTANSIKSGVTSPVWQGTGYALASSSTLTNFDGTLPFSATAWINSASTVAQALMGSVAMTTSAKAGWELALRQSSSVAYDIEFYLINTYPSNAIQLNSGFATFTTGSLHFVAVTYDGSKTAAGVKIYVDGTLLTNTIQNNSLTGSAASGLPLRFGARNDGTSEYVGAMAYAEVYNCILTPTQISTFSAAGPGIY